LCDVCRDHVHLLLVFKHLLPVLKSSLLAVIDPVPFDIRHTPCRSNYYWTHVFQRFLMAKKNKKKTGKSESYRISWSDLQFTSYLASSVFHILGIYACYKEYLPDVVPCVHIWDRRNFRPGLGLFPPLCPSRLGQLLDRNHGLYDFLASFITPFFLYSSHSQRMPLRILIDHDIVNIIQHSSAQ